jgi:alkylhydroperoxidase family enzyme
MAVHLTRSPAAAEDDVMKMREAGLSDEAIHDAVAITSYFNFVNRIALGLGVELEDEYKKD